MKNNLFDEIQKMKRMSFYDVKKTLNENHVKPLLLEDTGFSIIAKALKNVFKSTIEGTGLLTRDYITVGGKKFLVRGNQLYDVSNNSLVDDVVLPGGKTMKAADVIKLADGNFTNLSDETLDILFDTVEAAAKSDSAVREALETSAEESMSSLGHSTDYTDAAKKKIQELVDKGTPEEEAIEEVFKAWKRQSEIDHPNLNEEDFNFIKEFFFKGTKLKPKAPINSVSKTTKVLNYLGVKKFMSSLTRALSQLKGTKESFFEELVGTIRGWTKEIEEAGNDPFVLQEKYNKIAGEMEFLIDENTFITKWGQKWEAAQKNSIETIESEIRTVLKEEGWVDNEIDDFIKSIRSPNIQDILTNIEKKIQSTGYGAKSDITNFFNSLKEKIGYPENGIKWLDEFFTTYIPTKGLGSILNGLKKIIIDIPVKVVKGLLTDAFPKTLSALNYGVFRSPGEILTNLTRFGKGNKELALGFLFTYAELMALKITIGPIITGGAFLVLYGAEKITGLLGKFFPSLAADWLEEERKIGEIIRDEYLKWVPNFAEKTLDELFNMGELKVNDETYKELKSYIPIWFNTEFMKFEGGLLMAPITLLNSLLDLGGEDTEKTAGTGKEKIVNKLKETEEKIVNKADSIAFQMIATPESKMNYADKFDGRYYALKGFLDDKRLRKKLMRNNNLTESDCDRINKNLDIAFCPGVKSTKDVDLSNADEEDKGGICSGIWTKDRSKVYKIGGVGNIYKFIDDDGTEKPIKDVLSKDLTENYKIKMFDMKNLIRKIILEEEEEKTLKMKDWDEIFSFQKVDEKESGKYTDVKIKMDSVMDRMPHWRKKYKKQCEDIDNCDDDGEDDSFVRAVIDTHPEVVRVLFTKGMAHLTSSDDQEDLNESLHGLLAFLRESKNVEVEVWSVYRHPSSPDKIWSLVKGDYKPKELSSMDKKMQQSPGNSVEKKKDSLSELKKKESEAIRLLSTDEKKGLMELPIKVRNRVKEMIKKGWTTEKPSDSLMSYYKEDGVDSVFEEPIKVYKLRPNQTFFNFIKSQKSDDEIKRGFCRSIYYIEKEFDLPKEVSSKIDDILNKCENKLEGKYGQNYL